MTNHTNWVFIVGLAFLLETLLLCFCASHAYATTYDQKSSSLEKAFIGSDIVFRGIAKNSDGPNYVFEVKELYKIPDPSLEDTKEFTVYSGGIESPRFTADFEFLVFANYRKYGDGYRLTVRQSKTIPVEVIRRLKQLSSDPVLLDEQTGKTVTIFTGRVTSARHQEVKRVPSDAVSRPPYTSSDIDFEVSELLKNTTADPVPSDTKSITVTARFCGEAYRVGRTYLVFARSIAVPDPQPDNKRARKRVYVLDCGAHAALDFQERDDLRELSHFYHRN